MHVGFSISRLSIILTRVGEFYLIIMCWWITRGRDDERIVANRNDD
jgi:hypothetical protein